MNKQIMQYVGAGLCAGLVLGFVIKPSETAEPAGQAPETAAPAKPDPQPLLQAQAKLKTSAAALKDAQAKLTAQKEDVRRYAWLMDAWKDSGFGSSAEIFQMDSFNLNTGYAEFFGWNKEQVDGISRIARNTSAAVAEWEAAHAVYVETQEDKLTYELPAAPEQFKADYLKAMAETLPKEEYTLLAGELEKPFQAIENVRRVSLYIGQPPIDRLPAPALESEKDWMVVEVQLQDPQTEAFLPGTFTTIPYVEGRTIPTHWNHIFQLAIDPNAAADATLARADGQAAEDPAAPEAAAQN